MDYKNIVEEIKRITGLDVPVFYNDCDANSGGSPYFGIGSENAYEIFPDIDNCPMFDVEDFIENKHFHYYHIGLPDIIEKNKKQFVYEVTAKQLKSNDINIRLNKNLLELFIILHEFGHAHQLIIQYEKNVEQYIRDNAQKSSNNKYNIKSLGLSGTKEGLLMHKELATERYADNFAINNFKKVLNVL